MSGPAPRELAAYAPFGDLSGAALAVLGQLRREVGFSAWALTRVSGGTSTVLVSSDLFPAAAGEQIPWTDTLCHRVFEEGVPRVTLDVRAVASLRDTPFARRWGVGAYLSAPLSIDGETLFGTLCALDPEPREPEMLTRLPLVDLQARLLSTMLASDVRLDEVRRRAERAEADALVDAMTGLVNRRGWQLLLDREEQRCRRYGSAASVLVLDLDGLKAVNDSLGHPAGDVLLQRTAQVLRDATRGVDVVARLGGDEFAVLAVGTGQEMAAVERARLPSLLADARIEASLGFAARESDGGLAAAWIRADADMYRVKRGKQ